MAASMPLVQALIPLRSMLPAYAARIKHIVRRDIKPQGAKSMKKKCGVLIGFTVPLLAVIALVSLMVAVMGCDLLTSDEDDEKTLPAALKVVIGKGYDVTGAYAYSPEIKGAVLDLDRLTEDGKVQLDPNLSRADFETISGSTISEYQSNLAVKAMVKAEGSVEGVGSFEGEVRANFSEERTKKEEYAFATSRSLITKDAWFVNQNSMELTDYITDAFVKDVRDLAPDAVIAKYGTHVMLGGVLGARLNYSMSVRKLKETSSTEIGAYVRAKAEVDVGVGKGGAEVEASIDEKYKDSFETGTTLIQTTAVGGKVEYAQAIQSGVDPEKYDKWIESIEGNEIWSDYYPNSLYPIYELVGTSRWGDEGDELRNALYAAYCNYFVGKKINVGASTRQSTYYYLIEEGLISGGAINIGKGDADIGAADGKNTHWTVKVDLAQNGKNVDATFVYTVKEGGDDNSELQLTKTVTIPMNRDIVRLENPMTQTKSGVINTTTPDYKEVYVGNSDGNEDILLRLSIRVDGAGADTNHIGIKTDVKVYFTETVSD
jgi:hypothetical protein